MTIELGLRLGAEVLVACPVECHPRYGGADACDGARRTVEATVDRLMAAGVGARGEVAVALVGEGAQVLGEDVADFGAGLMIVAERRPSRLLRALGLSFGQRLVRTCRLPVLLLPANPPHPRSAG